MICADGSLEPPDDFMQVVPSTWPGSRAPHAWLSADTTVRGNSTLDWFGRGYVLLRAPDAADGQALVDALAARGASCGVETMPTALLSLYEKRFVLVRPDGHVCWRGDALPDDPHAVAARVTGASA